MANLRGKKYLDALAMIWGDQIYIRPHLVLEEKVLHMLHPHEKLQELIITNYGGRSFPPWVGDLSFTNMVFVKLENCERCKALPPLGQLQSLKDLRIEGMNGVVSVSGEFYGDNCSNPFPSLESLSFKNMKKWNSWFQCKMNDFPRLRNLTIYHCPELLGSLPKHLPSLEKLVVRRCQKLKVTISSLPKLCELEINECQEVEINECQEVVNERKVDLKLLKLGNISAPTFLTEKSIKTQELEIFGGRQLVSLLQREVGLLKQFTLLLRLQLQRCENLQNLRGLDCLTCLEELSIVECPDLGSVAEAGLPSILKQLKIDKCDSLTSIARAPLFSTVKEVEITFCGGLRSLLHEDEASSSMSNSNNSHNHILKALIVKGCPSLTSLSSSGAELPTTLECLRIYNCPHLKSIGKRWHNNRSLCSIEIKDCESLEALPKGLHNLSPLSSFKISDCKSLTGFPIRGLPAGNLQEFEISNCVGLNALPGNMHKLTTLRELTIANCPGIVSFPQEGFPINLTALVLRDLKICKAMFGWGLDRLTFLRKLEIKGGCQDMVFFPAENERMMLPTTLIDLSIKDFPSLKKLSSGFQFLTSLETLWFQNCPLLQHPEKYPPSLLQLDIDNCPLLVITDAGTEQM